MTKSDCDAAGQCDDFEFGQNGACVYSPASGIPFSCSNGDRPTRSGKCINSAATTSASCTTTWVTRARNATACAAYGARCFTPDGKQSAVTAAQCAACGGKSVPLYRWNGPVWKSAQMVSSKWVDSVTWRPINEFKQSLDMGKLENLFKKAIGKIVIRQMVSDFNQQYTALASVFQAFTCDCIDAKSDCFNSLITSNVGGCTADTSDLSNCNGVVIDSGTFNTAVPVSIDVDLVASANFLGAPSDSPLRKRATKKKTKANYKVVKNSVGTLVGQIVGNAMNYTFSTSASGNVSLCLPVDSSISLNTTAYPNYDIAPV